MIRYLIIFTFFISLKLFADDNPKKLQVNFNFNFGCELKRNTLNRRINIIVRQMIEAPKKTEVINKPLEGKRKNLEMDKQRLEQQLSRCKDERCRKIIEGQIEQKVSQIKEIDRKEEENYNRLINILEIQRKSLESSLTQLENSPECSEKFNSKDSYEEKKDLDLSEKKDKKEYERIKETLDAVVMAEYKSVDEFDKAVGAVLNSSEYVMKGYSKENKELDCSGFIGKVYDELSSENLDDKIKVYNEENCNKGDKSYCCSDKAMPCDKRSRKQYEYLSREDRIVDDITKLKPMSALYFEENGKVVHTMLFEYYGSKDNSNSSNLSKEIKCTPDYCPIVVVSTSKGKPVEEKGLLLINGCYPYSVQQCKNGKCEVIWKKQCFVGGGIP
jgi:hypothetical protein